MKTILILVLLGLQISLYGQKHFEIKAAFEANDNLEGVSCFKVNVKNITDSSLIILNNSKHLIGIMFDPKNSYFVVDYVLNNGKSGVISGIPLIDRNERSIKVDAHQSIENKFRALEIPGFSGFTGIFASDIDFSKVVKVRFRLTKLFYGIILGSGPYPNAEYASNWVTLKGQ